LWDLHATLEATLAEPLSREYDGLLAAARQRVRDAAT
jgi:hypothetical protein